MDWRSAGILCGGMVDRDLLPRRQPPLPRGLQPYPLLYLSSVHLSEGRGQNNKQPTPKDNNKRVVVFLCSSGI